MVIFFFASSSSTQATTMYYRGMLQIFSFYTIAWLFLQSPTCAGLYLGYGDYGGGGGGGSSSSSSSSRGSICGRRFVRRLRRSCPTVDADVATLDPALCCPSRAACARRRLRQDCAKW